MVRSRWFCCRFALIVPPAAPAQNNCALFWYPSCRVGTSSKKGVFLQLLTKAARPSGREGWILKTWFELTFDLQKVQFFVQCGFKVAKSSGSHGRLALRIDRTVFDNSRSWSIQVARPPWHSGLTGSWGVAAWNEIATSLFSLLRVTYLEYFIHRKPKFALPVSMLWLRLVNLLWCFLAQLVVSRLWTKHRHFSEGLSAWEMFSSWVQKSVHPLLFRFEWLLTKWVYLSAVHCWLWIVLFS